MTEMIAKILIVDDQYGIRKLLSLALDKYSVREASSGKEAVEIVKVWNPDIIIIDMKMPILNGVETVRRINARGFNPKIIFMTAYSEEEINDCNLEISGYISKPFDLEKLIGLVDKIIKQNNLF